MARKKYNQDEEWRKIMLDSQTRMIACGIVLAIDVVVYLVLFFGAFIIDVFFPVSVIAFLVAIGCIIVIAVGAHDYSAGKKHFQEKEWRAKRKKKRR